MLIIHLSLLAFDVNRYSIPASAYLVVPSMRGIINMGCAIFRNSDCDATSGELCHFRAR